MKKLIALSLVALVFMACSSSENAEKKAVSAQESACKVDDAACFESKCAKNDSFSCLRLAELTYWGQGGAAKDEKKAISIMQERCESGYGFACEKIGDFYRFGDANIKADRDEAKRYYDISSALYRKACEANEGAACFRLGYLHRYGVDNYFGNLSIEKDLDKTVAYYDKSCKLGYKFGCRNMGNYHRMGLKVEKSASKAMHFFDKACDLDSNICLWIGNKYKFEDRDYKASKRYYEKACDKGLEWGCADMGVMYFSGLGVAKDEKKAAEYFTKACELDKMGFVCHHIATQYKEIGDLTTAKGYNEKACKLGHKRVQKILINAPD